MSLNRALASISRGPSKSINLKAIAREYDVPYDTLRRRYLKKAEPKKLVRTHLRKLTPAQEQKAVDWSIFLSIQGRPVDKNTLTPKLSNSGRPGPVLGVRQNTGGAHSSSGIPCTLVLNPDEKGLRTGSRKVDQMKCLVPHAIPNTAKLQSNNLQLVTVIEYVTAEGVGFDPEFIFPGEGPPPNPESGNPRQLSHCQPGSTLRKIPNLALAPSAPVHVGFSPHRHPNAQRRTAVLPVDARPRRSTRTCWMKTIGFARRSRSSIATRQSSRTSCKQEKQTVSSLVNTSQISRSSTMLGRRIAQA